MSLLAAEPQFPQAVDLIQRIDRAYSWLSVVGMGLDGQGNIYLAGNASAIPSTIQIRQGPLGGVDVVVLKLDPTGQQILYGEAIGSSKDDSLNLMRVDASGNAYLFMTAEASDFPVSYVQPGSGNYSQAIVKLNNAGAMLYSTVIRWGLIGDWMSTPMDRSTLAGSQFEENCPFLLRRTYRLPTVNICRPGS